MRTLSAILVVGCLLLVCSPAAAQPPQKKDGKGKKDGPSASEKLDLAAYIMSFNKKNDGKLTRDELLDTRLHRLYDLADSNQDGIVTKEELDSLIARLAAEEAAAGKDIKGKAAPPKDGKKGKAPQPEDKSKTRELEQAKVRHAVDKALERIKAGVINYPENRSCFSCHHQAVAIFSFTAARKHGYEIDDELFNEVVDFSLNTFRNKPSIAKGTGVGGDSVAASYMLKMLATAEYPRDATTGALVDYLLVRQGNDGNWVAPAERPPTMGSPFTPTALAITALKKYGPPKDAKGAAATQQKIDSALAKARAWLVAGQPVDNEDRVYHLRGLVDAGVEEKLILQARDQLLQKQGSDGSWQQLESMAGDAFATATALTALHHAGLSSTHEAYRKGVAYLLSTQREDGAWVVQTRSRPFQRYFDNGDAGGRSQFISFAATSWAVMALLETLPQMDKKS